MKRTTKHSRIVAVAVSLAVALASSAAARVEEATVAVDGMSCPFCTYGVEKRLRRVPGCARVAVDLARGTATLAAAEGSSLDIGAIPEEVRRAGFAAGKLEIRATGSLVRDGERIVLRETGSEQRLELLEIPTALASAVTEAERAVRSVRLQGVVRFADGAAPRIVPTALEAMP